MTRVGDWIQTRSGRRFWPLDPRAEDVCIEDIAHALSLLCRFGGHCDRFYSVAEHSLLVADQFSDVEGALWALLHDASEAYVQDLARPFKRMMPEYRAVEDRVQLAICERFSLDLVVPARVHAVDRAILMDERRAIMSGSDQAWASDCEPLGILIACYQPTTAKILFLEKFHRLMRERG